MNKDRSQKRNELRDWIKDNTHLVTSSSFMIAAAAFARGLGTGKGSLWLVTCFVLLALLIMQEMFETFPKPGNDSEKLKAFKWVLGAAMANVAGYWLLLAYRSSATWLVGIVAVVLALNGGSALSNVLGRHWKPSSRAAQLALAVLPLLLALAASYLATAWVPNPGYS